MNFFRILNIKGINRYVLHLQAREIIEHGHHISVYQVQTNLPLFNISPDIVFCSAILSTTKVYKYIIVCCYGFLKWINNLIHVYIFKGWAFFKCFIATYICLNYSKLAMCKKNQKKSRIWLLMVQIRRNLLKCRMYVQARKSNYLSALFGFFFVSLFCLCFNCISNIWRDCMFLRHFDSIIFFD